MVTLSVWGRERDRGAIIQPVGGLPVASSLPRLAAALNVTLSHPLLPRPFSRGAQNAALAGKEISNEPSEHRNVF